ncbi:PmeII family type II restriction endonuclease [Arsenophonus nasoniae]|uniref:PmeII family type II restriction endonuclease n=1 Tax=Arsenophonus nasoniae TaxID=638 RepID=A0AA95GJM5_9GAMM|nr:PmeII family type II restriction endonuclease [Arsenophonus nasoniae]WGL95591.1 PmeII family type II restriction endonuclease [Arsenophonus nasoniae]
MINSQIISSFIESYIDDKFHKKKEDKIKKLKLSDITKRKNPYLFKAKGLTSASDLIKSIMEATVSSGEETIFGNFMEMVAIFTCSQALEGRKSSAVGIDLEFEKNNIKYLVSIKSGPNWGNSSQIKKMKDNFIKAKKILGTSGGMNSRAITCIEGCCYGYDSNPEKGTHLKLCGQDFWTLISDGNERLYKEIIEPIGKIAKEKNEKLIEITNAKLNLFTAEFITDYCNEDGSINWDLLVHNNSSSRSNFSSGT